MEMLRKMQLKLDFSREDPINLSDEVMCHVRKRKDQHRYYNLRRKNKYPEIGEIVYIRNHTLSSASEGINAKLAPKFKGPYRIEGFLSPTIVEIKDCNSKKKKTAHIQDIKT
uniref:Uncharacterized protein n=1 Tax=Megaselia scalaris TaxID=36166 RepID=T1GW57_MEGSC